MGWVGKMRGIGMGRLCRIGRGLFLGVWNGKMMLGLILIIGWV